MDTALLDRALNLGFGAAAAVAMFLLYRQESQEHTKAMAALLDRTLKVLEATTTAIISVEKTVNSITSMRELEDKIASWRQEPLRWYPPPKDDVK